MSGHNIQSSRDPVDALAKTLNDLDHHINEVDGRARRSESNRLSMLHLHAGAALVIAPTFGALREDGLVGPTFAVVRLFPGAPYSLAAVMFLGGLVLGYSTWRRHLTGEMVGLCMLLIWYLTVAISFLGAIFIWWSQGRPGGLEKPHTHTPAVYFHLTAVMCVHLYTLLRMAQASRRKREGP